MTRPGAAVIASVATLLACSSRRVPATTTDASTAPLEASVAPSDASAPDAAMKRPPLTGYAWQFELTDPPEGEAEAGVKPARIGFVSVPLGASEARPIMIALHGGGDRPDWACGEWRGITSGYPFMVCPRGPGAGDSGLGWSSPADTRARIAKAIAATKKIFGSWVQEGPMVLAGFSMGATQTALIARGDPKTYPRVAIVESAYAPEPAIAFAGPWAKGGGERAIFMCTTLGCEGPYRKAARNVAHHHVTARLNIAGTNQHGIWDEVVRSMRRDWPWVVDGMPGWEAYVPPPPDPAPQGKTEIFVAE